MRKIVEAFSLAIFMLAIVLLISASVLEFASKGDIEKSSVAIFFLLLFTGATFLLLPIFGLIPAFLTGIYYRIKNRKIQITGKEQVEKMKYEIGMWSLIGFVLFVNITTESTGGYNYIVFSMYLLCAILYLINPKKFIHSVVGSLIFWSLGRFLFILTPAITVFFYATGIFTFNIVNLVVLVAFIVGYLMVKKGIGRKLTKILAYIVLAMVPIVYVVLKTV